MIKWIKDKIYLKTWQQLEKIYRDEFNRLSAERDNLNEILKYKNAETEKLKLKLKMKGK